MLTRLQVRGFKNLVDVDVRFGPFTCIAGANGVGKSNLFDAMAFLSALADKPFVEAARSVRDDSGQQGNAEGLFHRTRDGHDAEMNFDVELIIPPEGIDDLGQKAVAAITFVKYSLVLGVHDDDPGALELRSETLNHITLKNANTHLLFHSKPEWRKSVLKGRRATPFISTEETSSGRVVKRHQEGQAGAAFRKPTKTLPRTVLSSVNTAESPTAMLVKRELQSWRQLQLEPSAMRRVDDFRAPRRVGADGSHLPSTLFQLARLSQSQPQLNDTLTESQVYGQVGSRLAELIDGVRDIRVDRDEKRESFTIMLRDSDGREFPARDLSDGTLRFLALSILELDSNTPGVICFEEPENGIHPERIPAMLQLLTDMCTDPSIPIGPGNPLRQVIVNTHSPALVAQVPEDSLVIAESREVLRKGQPVRGVGFGCLRGNWRTQGTPKPREVGMGCLLSYLNPSSEIDEEDVVSELSKISKPRRIYDLFRKDPQLKLWGE